MAFLSACRAEGRLRRVFPRFAGDAFAGRGIAVNNVSKKNYWPDFGQGPPAWYRVGGAPLPGLAFVTGAPGPEDVGAVEVTLTLRGAHLRRLRERGLPLLHRYRPAGDGGDERARR